MKFAAFANFGPNSDLNISRTIDFCGFNFLSVVVRDVRIVQGKYQVPICRGSATTLLRRGAIFAKCEN